MIWVGLERVAKVCTVIAVGIIMAGLSDRAPPFKVTSVDRPSGVPGGKISFDAVVWRDISRACDVTMYRSVFHSNGKRVDLDPQFYTAQSIRHMERVMPGRMRPEIEVPENATPLQDAYMASRLRYVCNPYQVFWPVDVTLIMPFDVLQPPAAASAPTK